MTDGIATPQNKDHGVWFTFGTASVLNVPAVPLSVEIAEGVLSSLGHIVYSRKESATANRMLETMSNKAKPYTRVMLSRTCVT